MSFFRGRVDFLSVVLEDILWTQTQARSTRYWMMKLSEIFSTPYLYDSSNDEYQKLLVVQTAQMEFKGFANPLVFSSAVFDWSKTRI